MNARSFQKKKHKKQPPTKKTIHQKNHLIDNKVFYAVSAIFWSYNGVASIYLRQFENQITQDSFAN